MSRRPADRTRVFRTLHLLVFAAVAIALIGISPIALEAFRGTTGKWERLSFIGQTYGAASAIISVLTLVWNRPHAELPGA